MYHQPPYPGHQFYRTSLPAADQPVHGAPQNVDMHLHRAGGNVANNHNMYGIRNVYPSPMGAMGVCRPSQSHQVITLVNPQGAYQHPSVQQQYFIAPPPPLPQQISNMSVAQHPFNTSNQSNLGYYPTMEPMGASQGSVRRERRAINIIDPKTGINVIDDLKYQQPVQSNSSSDMFYQSIDDTSAQVSKKPPYCYQMSTPVMNSESRHVDGDLSYGRSQSFDDSSQMLGMQQSLSCSSYFSPADGSGVGGAFVQQSAVDPMSYNQPSPTNFMMQASPAGYPPVQSCVYMGQSPAEYSMPMHPHVQQQQPMPYMTSPHSDGMPRYCTVTLMPNQTLVSPLPQPLGGTPVQQIPPMYAAMYPYGTMMMPKQAMMPQQALVPQQNFGSHQQHSLYHVNDTSSAKHSKVVAVSLQHPSKRFDTSRKRDTVSLHEVGLNSDPYPASQLTHSESLEEEPTNDFIEQRNDNEQEGDNKISDARQDTVEDVVDDVFYESGATELPDSREGSELLASIVSPEDQKRETIDEGFLESTSTGAFYESEHSMSVECDNFDGEKSLENEQDLDLTPLLDLGVLDGYTDSVIEYDAPPDCNVDDFKIKDLLVYHSYVDNLEADKLREFVEGGDNDDSISSADGDNIPLLPTSSNDRVATETENVELTLAEEIYELPDLPVLQESNGIMVIESKEMFARGDCVDQLSTEIKNSLHSCHVLENQDSIDENSLLPCHIIDDEDKVVEQSSKETKNSLSSPCHIMKDQDNIDEQSFVTEGDDLLSPVSVDEQIPIEDVREVRRRFPSGMSLSSDRHLSREHLEISEAAEDIRLNSKAPIENNERTKEPSKPAQKKSPDEFTLKDQLCGEPHRMTKLEAEKRLLETKFKSKSQSRIQYDREFLLHLQFEAESVRKPAGLHLLPEIIHNGPVVRHDLPIQPPVVHRKNFIDFTPNFARTIPGTFIRPPIMPNMIIRPPVIIPPNRVQPRRMPHHREQRKVIQVSLAQNVQLHTTENAWKPMQHKKENGADNEESEITELYRKVRGILNKLTPQKFETLIQKVYELKIDTEEKLKGCIDIIFEKAISEPSFSVAYANMAKCLINLKVPIEDKPNEMVTFRKLLLNRCQREFEKDKLEELDLEQMQLEINQANSEEKKRQLILVKNEAESSAKRRSLGNIRFIGELFKLKMLTDNIMHECVLRLLKFSHDEDNLECLCRLLVTIGQDLDHEKSKPRVDQYFRQLKQIIDTRKISARIKFMLQDVIELRRNVWVPRREDNKPKMIDQIHKEAEQEEQQKQLMIQRTSASPSTDQRNMPSLMRRQKTSGLIPISAIEDGWKSVSPSVSNMVDPSRMKLTKHQVDDNIQLGPAGGRPGYCAWQHGSSGGSGSGGHRASSVEQEKHQSNQRHSTSNGSMDSLERAGRVYNRQGYVPHGRGLAMQSMERDRNAAIAAVRNFASASSVEGQANRSNSRSNSRSASRDSSLNSESVRGSAEGNARQGPECPDDELEKMSRSILEEFLSIGDRKEASLCVRELQSPRAVDIFVRTSVNFVLDKTVVERSKTSVLLAHLTKIGLVKEEQTINCLRDILRDIEDIAIDIPKIWQYLSELIAGVIQSKAVSFSSLPTMCEPLVDKDKASMFLGHILKVATKSMGRQKASEMWLESNLKWTDFMPADKVDIFLEKEGLDWMQKQQAQERDVQMWLHSELGRLIVNRQSENEEVYAWIADNVGSPGDGQVVFIRALVTAVCNACLKVGATGSTVADAEQIKRRTALLNKYINHNPALELQALYALQHFVFKLHHPQGMLHLFFDVLYEYEVISEDAFYQWYDSSDPLEQQGKGVAKTCVNQFMSWIREGEYED